MNGPDYIETVLKKHGAHGFTYDQLRSHFVATFCSGLDITIKEYTELFHDRNIITDDSFYKIEAEKSTGKKLKMLLQSVRHSEKFKQVVIVEKTNK